MQFCERYGQKQVTLSSLTLEQIEKLEARLLKKRQEEFQAMVKDMESRASRDGPPQSLTVPQRASLYSNLGVGRLTRESMWEYARTADGVRAIISAALPAEVDADEFLAGKDYLDMSNLAATLLGFEARFEQEDKKDPLPASDASPDASTENSEASA